MPDDVEYSRRTTGATADRFVSAFEQRSRLARCIFNEFCDFSENVPKWSSEPELRLSTSITSYPPVAGSVELRRAIKDREGLRYGANLGVNNILITNGALHGLSLIFRCIGGPVLFQAPLYAGIYHQLANAAIRAKLLHDWTGNVKQFEHALEQHADVNAIYVNIPHNPTGECIDKEKFELLSWYCSRHDLYLIIDMVYDSFVYGSNCVNYPSDKRWAKTILVNSLSKNYGAPNLRAGWIAASEKTIGILRGALESDCIAVSGHVQEVACSLLRNGNDELVERVRRGRNTVRTVRRLPERATLVMPDAGTMFLLEGHFMDVGLLADYTLQEHGILISTSENYVGCRAEHIRLPLGYPVTVTEKALEGIATSLATWAGRHGLAQVLGNKSG